MSAFSMKLSALGLMLGLAVAAPASALPAVDAGVAPIAAGAAQIDQVKMKHHMRQRHHKKMMHHMKKMDHKKM